MIDARRPAFDADFAEAFDVLAHNAVVRRAMGARATRLVDGMGAGRVADAVLQLASR